MATSAAAKTKRKPAVKKSAKDQLADMMAKIEILQAQAAAEDIEAALNATRVSEILCVRHNMTERSMYAKQEDDESGSRLAVSCSDAKET